jgi:hypothetical protein
MYYPISEEELQVVQDCMQQISLLVDLGCGISDVQTTVGTEALLSFLIAQREALQGAVEAVQAREVMRGDGG